MTRKELFKHLVKCCKAALKEKKLESHDVVIENFTELLGMARIQGVEPVFCHFLTSIEALNNEDKLIIKKRHSSHIYNNLYRTQELLRINKVFVKKKIDALFYKGSVISDQLYGQLGLRSFSDIDVLINFEDFKKVDEQLRGLGYQLKTEFASNTEKDNFINKRNEIGYSIKKGNINLSVDLHWNIISPFLAINMDYQEASLRNSLIDYKINEQSITSFEIQFLPILFSIHHGINDLWNKLKHIYDWAVLMKKYQDKIDWSKALSLAKHYDIENSLFISLAILEKLFEVSPPALLKKEVNNQRVQKLAQQRIEKLTYFEGTVELDKWYYKIWYRFKTSKQLKTKWTICLKSLEVAWLKLFTVFQY